MKQASCGVIVTNGYFVLICHPTNASWQDEWNLPKGLQDPGETVEDTAVRELEEETGIVADELGTLKYIGRFEYKPEKDLELFALQTDRLPRSKDLVCTSTFQRGGKDSPEMDGFSFVTWDEAGTKVSPALRRIWSKIRQKFIDSAK